MISSKSPKNIRVSKKHRSRVISYVLLVFQFSSIFLYQLKYQNNSQTAERHIDKEQIFSLWGPPKDLNTAIAEGARFYPRGRK